MGLGEREYSTIGWGEPAMSPILGELEPWDGGMGRSLGRSDGKKLNHEQYCQKWPKAVERQG